MTAGSWIVAISRRQPPQSGHASTSMAKARCMRRAQLQDPAVRAPLARSRAAAGTSTACDPRGGSDATRPYVTTRRRQRARGANSPSQMSRFVSGRGVIAASRFSCKFSVNLRHFFSAGLRHLPGTVSAGVNPDRGGKECYQPWREAQSSS
jgi:hypothetical protein